MPLKPVGINDDNTFPGRVGTAISNAARAAVSADLAKKLERLTVGTVTAGPSGSEPQVTITGTAPAQTLNFVIPSGGSAGSGGGGGMPFVVASSTAPSAIRNAVSAGGGYLCDGTNDEVQINAALTAYKSVQLTEGNYSIAATITVPRGRTLSGAGADATRLTGTSGLSGRFIYSTTDWLCVRDLGLTATGGTAHGIEVNATSQTGFVTGADACVVLENIQMRYIGGDGVVMTGGYNRDSKLSKIHVWDGVGRGFFIDSPDGTGHQLISGTCGGHGFEFGSNSSNWRISNSKAWFSDQDGWFVRGTRLSFNQCEGQDNEWSGMRMNGNLCSVNGFVADSNSWLTGNALAGVHSGLEIGRSWNGTSAGTQGGYDITVTNVMSWDKNESGRGRAQAYGIRVRSGARGVYLSGFQTGEAGGSHANVNGGVRWDTASDQTHTSNYCSGLNHNTLVNPGGGGSTTIIEQVAGGATSGGGLAFYDTLAPVVARNLTSGGEYSNTTSATGQLSRTSRQWFTPAEPVGMARLLFQNLSTVRGLVTVPITVSASVERTTPVVGTGTLAAKRVTFNGAFTAQIPPGGSVLSDPVMVGDNTGGGFFVRTCTAVAGTGQIWPNNGYTRGSLYPGEMSWFGDYTNSTATDGFAGTTLAHGPAAILTTPTVKPTVAVIGDSISQGSGDEGSGEGYWDRWAKPNKVRLTRAAVNGELARYILDDTNNRDTVWAQVTGVDWLVCALGTNDVAQWQSETGIKTQLEKVWDRMKASSRRGVYQTTIPPYTQSSDGWTTVSGQTLRTFENIRVNLNAWLRSGAPITGRGSIGASTHPLTGVLDIAPAVEDATGKWLANMTADGVHPSPAGHTALASRLGTVTPSTFRS